MEQKRDKQEKKYFAFQFLLLFFLYVWKLHRKHMCKHADSARAMIKAFSSQFLVEVFAKHLTS